MKQPWPAVVEAVYLIWHPCRCLQTASKNPGSSQLLQKLGLYSIMPFWHLLYSYIYIYVGTHVEYILHHYIVQRYMCSSHWLFTCRKSRWHMTFFLNKFMVYSFKLARWHTWPHWKLKFGVVLEPAFRRLKLNPETERLAGCFRSTYNIHIYCRYSVYIRARYIIIVYRERERQREREIVLKIEESPCLC